MYGLEPRIWEGKPLRLPWAKQLGELMKPDCVHNLVIKCYSWKKWRDSVLCAEKLRIFQVLQQRLRMRGAATTNVHVFVKWSS